MSRSVIEREWQAHGLDCAVLRMDMGHRCGYVQVPETHPWHGQSYVDALDGRRMPRNEKGRPDFFADCDIDYGDRIESHVEVHGGLTFAGEGLNDEIASGWWFGFDCAHSYDSPDSWTEDVVAAETEQLAKQIAEEAE